MPTNAPDYNAALNAKLAGGTAGDIIICRPFDQSLAMSKAGQLLDLTNLPGMENFAASTKVAWQTDDGKSTYCLPMASVLHGFIYNLDAFLQSGDHDPAGHDGHDFHADLDKLKADGTYVPIDLGTHDQWEAATMGRRTSDLTTGRARTAARR